MSKFNLSSLLSVAALSLGLSLSANATTITLGGSAPASSVSTVFGAGNTAVGGTWSFGAGTGTSNTSLTNFYADPYTTSAYYAYTEAGDTITASFAGGLSSFSMFWGSPDTGNSITIDGVTYTSASVGLPTTGSNSDSQEVTFTAAPGTSFTNFSFTSSENSFEFGTVATVAATPEPASIALLAGGLLAIGAGAIRRRKSA